MQENRNNFAGFWWGWLESQVGHPLRTTGFSHEFIGTLGNSQGGPGHLEAQPPRWCFSSTTGGSRGEAKLMWQESPTYFDSVFFFWMFSVVGERKSWKRKGVGSSTLLEWQNFPLRRFTVELDSENPLRICGTALLGTCRFANPLLYSCGNAPAKNGLLWCWLRWVFSMPGWIWRNLFHHLLLVDHSSGGFLLIPLILAIWKPVKFDPSACSDSVQDHCHRWRDTRPVFMSKSAGFELSYCQPMVRRKSGNVFFFSVLLL